VAHVLDRHRDRRIRLSVPQEDRQALLQCILAERELLRPVEESAAEARPVDTSTGGCRLTLSPVAPGCDLTSSPTGYQDLAASIR
jgi:hypothetical protein